jgi:hypothetical protein
MVISFFLIDKVYLIHFLFSIYYYENWKEFMNYHKYVLFNEFYEMNIKVKTS